MDIETLRTIIVIISTAFVALGGALILVVTWIVIQAYKGVKVIDDKLDTQFRLFGQQLAAVRELVKDEFHALEVRVAKLEEWRNAASAHGVNNKGD
jgi:uncharacterized membrane protein